jgi:putative CRISPR-associated protein (TIGR02619 family)
MTVYLCTSGTSASRALRLEPGERFDAEWVDRQGGIERAASRLFESFKEYSMENEEALHNKLSAEIHSLARMGLSAGDSVYLFASETLDGQACARAVKRYLEQRQPGVEVIIEKVEGLQVDDEVRFRTVGVVNYVRKILRIIDDHGVKQCMLNPTGGYKALVPYTVLIGMLRQVPARYIFERSDRLLFLPPLPIEFARGRLESVRPVLEEITRETSVPASRFEERLSWEARKELECLFERDGKDVTLSAIGLLVFEELKRPSALTPFLSRKALDGLLRLRGRHGCDPERYLQRVSRDREAFEADRHGNAGEGLTWLKPGRTPDRYLVSEEGWRLVVWEVCDHEEYEGRSAVRDLGRSVRAERASKYAPFVRMELVD